MRRLHLETKKLLHCDERAVGVRDPRRNEHAMVDRSRQRLAFDGGEPGGSDVRERSNDVANRLDKIYGMWKEGVLTRYEFKVAKKKVLNY